MASPVTIRLNPNSPPRPPRPLPKSSKAVNPAVAALNASNDVKVAHANGNSPLQDRVFKPMISRIETLTSEITTSKQKLVSMKQRCVDLLKNGTCSQFLTAIQDQQKQIKRLLPDLKRLNDLKLLPEGHLSKKCQMDEADIKTVNAELNTISSKVTALQEGFKSLESDLQGALEARKTDSLKKITQYKAEIELLYNKAKEMDFICENQVFALKIQPLWEKFQSIKLDQLNEKNVEALLAQKHTIKLIHSGMKDAMQELHNSYEEEFDELKAATLAKARQIEEEATKKVASLQSHSKTADSAVSNDDATQKRLRATFKAVYSRNVADAKRAQIEITNLVTKLEQSLKVQDLSEDDDMIWKIKMMRLCGGLEELQKKMSPITTAESNIKQALSTLNSALAQK